MVGSITGLTEAGPSPIQVTVSRWVKTNREFLKVASARLAEEQPVVVVEDGNQVRLTGRLADSASLRASVHRTRGRGRGQTVQIDIAPWAPDAAEIIVRPAARRWKRGWSARSESRYFRAAELAAAAVAKVLQPGGGGGAGWPRSHALPDGSLIWVKPLRREDRESYLRAVASLSPATIALRFGRPRSGISDAEVEEFLDNGHDGREALVATGPDKRRILGVARLAPKQPGSDTAEVAVVIADDWQHHGVGQLLTADLRDCAIAAGYRRLYATSDVDNTAIATLLRRQGFRATGASLGSVEWSADISHDLPAA